MHRRVITGANSPRLDHAKMFQDFIKGAVDDSNPIHFLKSNSLFFNLGAEWTKTSYHKPGDLDSANS